MMSMQAMCKAAPAAPPMVKARGLPLKERLSYKYRIISNK